MTNTNVVRLEAGTKISGIVPRNLDEVVKLSEMIYKSNLAPSGMKSVEQICIALMHGAELGLMPMQALSKIAIIGNRPSIYGDAIPALLWAKGFKIDEYIEGTGEQTTAVCVVTRPDGTTIQRKFSVQNAKQARLWGKQGTWTQFPERMLAMRARSFASRDGAAEILSGLYLKEEVEDFDLPKDVKINEPVDEVNAENSIEYIDDEQVAELLLQINSPPVNNLRKFFEHFEINSLKQLPKSQYDTALSMIATSKKRMMEVQ